MAKRDNTIAYAAINALATMFGESYTARAEFESKERLQKRDLKFREKMFDKEQDAYALKAHQQMNFEYKTKEYDRLVAQQTEIQKDLEKKWGAMPGLYQTDAGKNVLNQQKQNSQSKIATSASVLNDMDTSIQEVQNEILRLNEIKSDFYSSETREHGFLQRVPWAAKLDGVTDYNFSSPAEIEALEKALGDNITPDDVTWFEWQKNPKTELERYMVSVAFYKAAEMRDDQIKQTALRKGDMDMFFTTSDKQKEYTKEILDDNWLNTISQFRFIFPGEKGEPDIVKRWDEVLRVFELSASVAGEGEGELADRIEGAQEDKKVLLEQIFQYGYDNGISTEVSNKIVDSIQSAAGAKTVGGRMSLTNFMYHVYGEEKGGMLRKHFMSGVDEGTAMSMSDYFTAGEKYRDIQQDMMSFTQTGNIPSRDPSEQEAKNNEHARARAAAIQANKEFNAYAKKYYPKSYPVQVGTMTWIFDPVSQSMFHSGIAGGLDDDGNKIDDDLVTTGRSNSIEFIQARMQGTSDPEEKKYLAGVLETFGPLDDKESGGSISALASGGTSKFTKITEEQFANLAKFVSGDGLQALALAPHPDYPQDKNVRLETKHATGGGRTVQPTTTLESGGESLGAEDYIAHLTKQMEDPNILFSTNQGGLEGSENVKRVTQRRIAQKVYEDLYGEMVPEEDPKYTYQRQMELLAEKRQSGGGQLFGRTGYVPSNRIKNMEKEKAKLVSQLKSPLPDKEKRKINRTIATLNEQIDLERVDILGGVSTKTAGRYLKQLEHKSAYDMLGKKEQDYIDKEVAKIVNLHNAKLSDYLESFGETLPGQNRILDLLDKIEKGTFVKDPKRAVPSIFPWVEERTPPEDDLRSDLPEDVLKKLSDEIETGDFAAATPRKTGGQVTETEEPTVFSDIVGGVDMSIFST